MCVWFGKWTRFLRRRTQLLGYEAERQKPRMSSQCEVILLRRLSPAKFIRLSWITSDEKKVNKPLRRTLRTETLDRSNARDLEQVVRLLREAKLHSAKFCSPVSPSSTTRMWGRKSINHCEKRSGLNHTNSPLAFLAHLHYHRTNKKKEFSICTRIAFVVIINVFIPG